MHEPRRAATVGASPRLARGLRPAVSVLSVALAAVTGLWAVVSLRMARRVVTPAARIPDTRIVDVNTAAQTITLGRSADTTLPGRYGLFTTGSETYLKLGSVLAEDGEKVTRKLLTEIATDSRLSSAAGWSGWYYSSPDELHVPFSSELVAGPLGPCPAWLFPAPGPTDTWVIQVHGRGTTRLECLRAVPLFRDVGFTSLVVSYRNDGEAPRSRAGTYALGATEWRDVDAALGFARRRGAKNIILMGWSMGGAVALQVALQSSHRDLIRGIVLDSPVIDWRRVLSFQARQMGVPETVTSLAMSALGSQRMSALARTGGAIPFDRLDVVARADELKYPILILHSDDDGFVPSDASHDLVEARPDLVEMQVFETARHAKLWNYDSERWTSSIRSWVRRRVSPGASAESS